MKKYMTTSIASLILLVFSGCAVTSMNNANLEKKALLACGLGYNAETGADIKVAYNMAKASKDVDFKTAIKDALETPITQIVKEKMTDTNTKDMIRLIEQTQQCVANEMANSRPKTRKDYIYACRDDLQERVAGKGKDWPRVKGFSYVPPHPKNSENALVMNAFVDHGGSASYRGHYLCEIKDGQYYGLTMLKKY